MLDRPQSLCVLGCGTMGQAIVAGVLRDGWLSRDKLVVTARRASVATQLEAKLEVQRDPGETDTAYLEYEWQGELIEAMQGEEEED